MTLELVQFIVVFVTGIYIIYKDLKERIIPNKAIILLLVLGTFISLLDIKHIWAHILGFLVVGSLLFILAAVTKAFGMGDVKYMFSIGLILGLETGLNALLIAFVMAGIVSSLLLLLKKVKKEDYIAFGPYLVLGSLLSILYSIF